MKKIKLFCVAPYEGMKDLMQNIADRRSDVEMTIRVGDLCSGPDAAIEEVGSDIDAIISRGGTAEILRNQYSTPTIEIPISVYDVLRAIRMARNISKNFAIVGFGGVTRVAQSLCEMLQYNIPVFTIRSTSGYEEQMRILKEQGYDLVVGDTNTVKIAGEFGINGILFTSGIEAIEDAVNSAVQLCRYHAGLKSTINLLSEVISGENRRVVVFDSSGNLRYSTLQSIPDDLLQLLKKNIPRVISGDHYNSVFNLDGRNEFIQGQRLQFGQESYCLYGFRETDSIKLNSKQGIRFYNSDEIQEAETPEYYLGGNETINNIMGTVHRYCGLKLPVLIDGEPGCGMDTFAVCFYKRGTLNHCAYVVADASVMNESSWEYLLTSDNSPLCEKQLTIYMKNMECVPAEQQNALMLYLKDSLVCRRNRLIFSFATQGKDVVYQNELYRFLLETLNSLALHLPPLRQHKEDIPVLIGLAINSNNLLMGTQTIGLMPEAVQFLQEYPWENNVDQLRHTIRELVASVNSPYISLKDVQALLQTRQTGSSVGSAGGKIDMTKTLDEIIKDIIQTVFYEEDMNQSQTAKRLGISRSTLWRMMKRSGD
ncbi:Anaerobic nitric oxide reductase transcription regulator NorR [bioreactor metagenome]|uniref:Anaerobic nitric oxide reductase transcription regulator NorR n=1 Tax=bioreactor metagenome TaxID=1076179 RepID=A0A644YA50_9ZZZZ